MNTSSLQLSVACQASAAPTTPFLDDICSMLAVVADAAGVSVAFAAPGPEVRVALVPDTPALRSALQRHLGLHRAQLASPSHPLGRIITALVTVSLSSQSEPRLQSEQATPIRTYNYPGRSVFVHASGARLPLEDVLAGRAG